MAQADARDPWWMPVPLDGPERDGRLRVALSIDPAGEGADPSVRVALERAAKMLEDAGYIIEPADPPDLVAASEAWNAFAQYDAQWTVRDAIDRFGDEGARRSMALMAARVPPVNEAGRIAQLAARSTHLRRWQLFMQRYPLILCPTATEPALPWGVDVESDASMARLFRSHRWLFATSLIGLPCATVPTGLASGVPTGRAADRPTVSRGRGARCLRGDRARLRGDHADRPPQRALTPIRPPSTAGDAHAAPARCSPTVARCP
jgi:amidase